MCRFINQIYTPGFQLISKKKYDTLPKIQKRVQQIAKIVESKNFAKIKSYAE